MTANTQAVATSPVVEASKAPKRPAFVFAAVTPETASKAAKVVVDGVAKVEGSKVALLVSLSQACALIAVPLTAAQYDRQFKSYLDAAFAAASRRKNSPLKAETAAQYASKLKTAVLAVCCGVASPNAGETFWGFYDRAAPLLGAATVTQGDKVVPVWDASKAKTGTAKGGRGGRPKGSGSTPGAVASANASAATSGESGMNRSAPMAAALILARNNEARAQRLVSVMQTHAEAFDRWAASILEEKPAKGSKPVSLAKGEPATAMAAALEAAQADKLAKAS